MKTAVPIALTILGGFTLAVAQDGPRMSFIKMSPILNSVDTDQNGVLSASEIEGAPAALRKLDKNNDGKLSREEAGLQFGRGGRGGPPDGGRGRGEGGGDEPPAPAPTAEELTATLMMFDANGNGKLEKSEVPDRMQGLFERGDTNHDGVLTRDEIAKLAEANRQQAGGGDGRGGEGRGGGRGGDGRGRGPGGPGQFDLAFNALDKNQDGEISADEIASAAASLKTLDKNGDGQVTEDEVTPGGGRGPGR